MINSETGLAGFISMLKTIDATDAYLYLRATDYLVMAPALVRALTELSRAGLCAWGLEGSRDSFSDVAGSAELYAAADALVAFNTQRVACVKFIGFASDMEPQDGQAPAYPVHFHNGIPDSLLASRQAADRQALMADWLAIHRTLGRR